MAKLIILGSVLWLLIFLLRIFQIGGLDPAFSEPDSTFLLGLRDNLSNTVEQILPYPQSSILSGMLLGVGEKLPFSLKKDLQATSTIHLIVVSGQNLSILAGFVMSLAAFLGRKKTILLTMLIIVFYSFLTGLQVPVLRAALMAILTYSAQFLGKESQGSWVLALTAMLMLLFNPNWLLSISFQLSFLATLGVVVISPIFLRYLKKVPILIRQDLAVTMAAQVLTLPVIAFNFNQISLTGLLVNVLVIWTSPLIMMTGIISLLIGLINNFIGQLFGLLPVILITYFIDLVQLFANIPFTSIKIGETGILMWVGYYLLFFVLIRKLAKKTAKK